MRLLPRSLFGRNLLLIVGLLALSQLVSALLLRQLVIVPRIEQAAQVSATTLAALHSALDALPRDHRPALVARLNALGSLRIDGSGEPPAAATRPPRPLLRTYLSRLDALLPDQEARVEWHSEDDFRLWARLALRDGQHYWVGIALPRLDGNGLPRLWVWLSAICSGLALLGAWLIQRRINRPLQELIRASEHLGQGPANPPTLAEDGPDEIAAVSRSFNRMMQRLDTTERERAVMLAGVSHDLRSPLAKLRLAVEILDGGDDPALQAGMVRNIEHMDAIIGQFLAFARADEAEPTTICDLAGLVRSTLEALGASPLFALDLPPLAPQSLRPLAMQRLLANLVENALRHGAAPYEITLRADDDGIRLSVFDRGPGLGDGDPARLKQAFTRGDAARNGPPGAGLGLAIAERVANLHGGRLDLLKRPGGGCEARLSLPPHPGQPLQARQGRAAGAP